MTRKKSSIINPVDNPNEYINWYQKIPSSLKTKYHNPFFQINHPFDIPARILIVGNSGSGKSTLVLEILRRMADTFGHIHLICMNKEEPLYRYLHSKLKPEELTIYEGIENIPVLDKLDKYLQHIVIFDDLVLEKKQDKIEEYFIRSRKIAKGVTCIYLTQTYFGVPKVIRLNCNYIICKKLSSTRDLKMMMKDFSLGLESQELIDIYKYCTSDPKDFLLVDIQTDPSERFKKNFFEVIQFQNEN